MNSIPLTGRREGFTLIEVITSVVLLSAVLVCLGGLSYHAARQAINVGNSAGRQAAALETVNWLVAMDWDSLTAVTEACDTAAPSTELRFERCYEVTQLGRIANVEVTVTPLRAGSFAQTFRFSRVEIPTYNALNAP